uniref:Putative lipoprotein n=1 Tax=Lutzomyia longipalpis TaxID=7200 RepID=A0A7G3AUB2_LUTLO
MASVTKQSYIKVLQYIIFLGLFTYITEGRRNPLKDPSICGRPECDDTNWKFIYEPNTIYRYEYSLHVRTQFAGSGENTSDIHVIGDVEMIFPKKCEGLLRILSLEARDRISPQVEQSKSKNSDEFDDDYTDQEEIELHPTSYKLAEDVTKYELRFSFQDGLIAEICPHDDEENWVLNLKRGILSAFQNTMTRFDIDHHTVEKDISGVCDVKYILEGGEDTALIIKKIKNTESCKHRYKTNSILQTTSYEFHGDTTAWPILQTDSYCNISVDHSIYNGVKCYERHQLVPFSNNQSGAVTESTLQLRLNDEIVIDYAVDDEFQPIERRSTLLFDHAPTAKPTHGEIKASREYLKEMCKLGFPDIQRDFPDILMKFLSNARLLSYNALQQLLARAGSICENGKNHVLDSLPYIGSTAAVLLIRDQIVRNAISPQLAQDWISSIAYISHPDDEVVGAMLTLIEYGKGVRNPSYVLASTAVVHSYCKHHANCHEKENVRKILQHLEQEIMTGMNYSTHTRKTKEDLLVALKGLGNIGVISENFEEVLEEIITDSTIPIDVRLQAIFVFRRLDCNKSKNYFLDIYGNFTENSEIRIAAYLQTMKCPDYHSIECIRDILVREEVNQVGSFVWSHLTNLAKSSSPVRVEAQGLIVDGDLGTKYKLDIRKFSRNFEYSVFFNDYNFGANVDSNLIFGTDSYLPRTFSLNFTTDLFGESVNLLEISTRTEGFEHYLEAIFGPKGPLNTEKFKEKFSFLGNYWKDSSISSEEDDINFERLNMKVKPDSEGEYDDSMEVDDMRGKREVDTKEELDTSISNLGHKLKYNFNNPKASFGLKVFGNDLKYFTIEGHSEVANTVAKMNPMKYITELLSGKEITYTKSGIFLDLSYEIPMSSGVPLALTAQGASSVDMRMSGLLRAADFIKTRHFNVEGRLKPSVSLDIVTSMQSDLFYMNTGIKVKSNLYSSSSVEAKLKVRGTKLISLQFSIPQNRSNIFSARSELLVVKDNEVIPQIGIKKRFTNQTCTWPVIDRAIGLKLCTEYSLPDASKEIGLPSFILTGPINVDIHLDKADPTAKIFLFEFRWDTNTTGSVASFIFQTPGSAIPRSFIANLTTSDVENTLTMSFTNAATSYAAVGTYKNTENEKNLEVYLDINGQKGLSLEMGYNRTEIKNGYMYFPSFFLTVNNDKIAGLGGMLKLTNKKDVSQWDVNVVFETKRLQAKLTGYITETEASLSTKLAIEYRFLDQKVERVDFQGDIANRSQKGRTDYQGSAKLRTTAYEKYNFASNMKYVSAMGHAEWLLNVNNAKDLVNPDYNLGIRMVFARFHHVENGRTTASIEITRPISKTDLKFMIKYEEKVKNGSEHNVLVVARYAPQKEITGVVSMLFPRRQLFAVDVAVNLTVPAFDSCTVNLKLYEKARKDYSIDFKGTWFSGHSMTAIGKYEDRSSSIKTFHHVKLSIQSPSFEDTLVDARYSRDEYEVFVDCQVDYSGQPYGLSLKYSEQSTYETYTYTEIKWKDKFYWLSANMTSSQPKQLIVEIHLDKFRDIHVILRCLSNDFKKEAGIEIKWDANRDPTQKLAIFGEFNTPMHKSYDGRFIIAYPERTFSGTFDYKSEEAICKANARLGWSSFEAIELKYESGNLPGPVKDMWTTIIINTPFDGWKQNSINTGLHYNNNLLLLNGSVVWGENFLGVEFMGDYEIKDPIFGCEFRTALNSSIAIMPTFIIHFKHRHDDKKVDTDATVKHRAYNESTQTYSIKSSWQFDVNSEYQNVSGSLAFRSPFENYTTGALVTKFSPNDKRRLKGAADLDLEDKKFTLAVEGHIKKITDNMLVVNITTPIERFRNIAGRFGINEKNRHIVAEVKGPKDALGVELLFIVNSFTNFDIKFHLATPLEAFEKILLIALMQNDKVDFRGGWNKVVLGFVGVWRFVNFTDFEYSYKVYTPLDKFEENGLVVRILKTHTELDSECTFKLAQYKVGYKVAAKPKPILIRQLHLKNIHSVINDLFSGEEEDLANEQDYEEDGDEDSGDDYEDDYLNFIAFVELDTIIFPTLKGNLDVEEVDDTYYCFGTIILPQGMIEFRDKFYFPDYMTHKNTLRIVTPFAAVKEIKSNYQYKN